MLTLSEMKEALELVERGLESHAGEMNACGECDARVPWSGDLRTGFEHKDGCRYVRVRDALKRAIDVLAQLERGEHDEAIARHPARHPATREFCIGYRAARQLSQCAITDTIHCAAKFLGSREEGAAAIQALGAEVKRVIDEEDGT
jgi:hypothetical protein